MNTIISIIVIILIFIFIGYFIIDYGKNNSLSVKEYINNNLDSIFFSLGLLFSIFGLILMISNLIEFICGLVKEEVDANAYAYIVLLDFFKLKVDFKLLLKDDAVADVIMKRVDVIIENEYEYE